MRSTGIIPLAICLAVFSQVMADERSTDVTALRRATQLVADVDAVHALSVARGYAPEFEPRDAEWGERYFHLCDPDGHELSFAKRL